MGKELIKEISKQLSARSKEKRADWDETDVKSGAALAA